jgi:MOSC domain-containing protein YiiM
MADLGGHFAFTLLSGSSNFKRKATRSSRARLARTMLGDEVEIQITSYVAPCKNIGESFRGGEFTRISQKLHPGDARLYARVLREGHVAAGQQVQVLSS